LSAAFVGNREIRNEGWILGLLFAASLGIRLIRLFELDVWFDEVVIVLQLHKSFAEIWNFCKTDNYPPLYVWVMKIWTWIFPGQSSLRVGTALLGSLTPPAAYLLGKTLLDRRLGWILGIACVLSPALLYYHQMIRMYSLFPLFACLSVIGFVRGLQTNQWKYWILTAAANLLGFYTFLFMAFLIVAEALVLAVHFRLAWQAYRRPFLTHILPVLLMLIWAFFALQQVHSVRDDFWIPAPSPVGLFRVWVFLGTGIDFNDRHPLAFLILNLPFLMGLLFLFPLLLRQMSLRIGAALFALPLIMVYVISLIGQSIFLKRYFIFLLPLYLALSLAGWLSLTRVVARRIGICVLLLILTASALYYFADYYDQHFEYGFIRCQTPSHHSEGHALSQMAALIRSRIAPGECVIHYGNELSRAFSFFPMIWYNQRSVPEYIYSRGPLKSYLGRQYLQPGDQIHQLSDLPEQPPGIWLVILDARADFFDDSTSWGPFLRWGWRNKENLPLELQGADYRSMEAIRMGNVTALYYRRSENGNNP